MPENSSKTTKNRGRRAPLLIRADANSRMGTGHVMRCIALGQAWQDGGQRSEDGGQRTEDGGQRSEIREQPAVIFICATIPDALADRVKSEGFGLIRIEAEPGSAEDIRQTLEVISGLRSHPSSFSPWLMLDGYHFGLDYQRAVRQAGCKLLLIDDYNHLPEYDCDILLNQNINAAELKYTINPEARLLLGTGYAMLRKEFRALTNKERRFPDVGSKVLVTLGGADPDNVTLKVIEALRLLNRPDLCVKIVVGSANLHLESLRGAVERSTFDLRLLTDVKDMPGLMHWADSAVSAGGSTCWELCCLGVPFMTLVLAENQRGLAAGLDQRGIAPNAQIDPQEIAEVLTRMLNDPAERERMSFAGRALIDGFGADRVLYRPAKESGLDLFAGRLTLRPAEARDMDLFWRWANDPDVRRNSYHPQSIPPDDHQHWFEKKLKSADSAVFVLELDGVPAGQVRYDRTDAETAEIDFSIDRRFRGLGMGVKILEMSSNEVFNRLPINTVRAEVFQSNLASQAAFEKTGFKPEEACVIKGIPILAYSKTGFAI